MREKDFELFRAKFACRWSRHIYGVTVSSQAGVMREGVMYSLRNLDDAHMVSQLGAILPGSALLLHLMMSYSMDG
jgi:hypothetical protein